jgi:serine protease Do
MNYSIKEILRNLLICGFGLLAAVGFYKLYHHQVHLEDVITVLLANDKQGAQRMLGIPATSDDKTFEAPTSWSQVQKKATDTVVQVFSETFEFNWIEPYRAPDQREGVGSGFFINNQGEFLTNYHVVSQAPHISIQVPSTGQERFDAEVIGVNPDRDVALCRLTQSALEKLQAEVGVIPFLEFGDSDVVKRGHDTLALGYPLGQEHLKSTQGIISGRERVRLLNNHLCFQITAPINPGNSGGPSLDTQGRVIGVNFAGVMSAQNVGYIIPINDIKIALKDLYKMKLLRKPQLGGLFLASNEELMRYFKNPIGGGYYIAKIFKNSVLEKAGILEGDVITEIDGHKLDYYGETVVNWSEDKVSLSDLLSRKTAGDKVTFVLHRKGQRKVISFNLEPRFSQPIRFIYPEFERECIDYEVLGGLLIMELRVNHILIMEGCTQLLKYASPENQYESKLIITHVLPTSAGYKLRKLIGPGTVIDEVNGVKVGTLDELRQALQNSKNTEFITVNAAEKRFVVMSTQSILDNEDRLARTFFYKPSLASQILREQVQGSGKSKSVLSSLLPTT